MSSDNTIRSFGYSNSGIDVASTVSQLMEAARQPYYQLEQKQTLDAYKKEAYNQIYTSLQDFESVVQNFELQKTLSARKVTSSNTNVATITANGDAPTVTHTLSVSQVASGVTESSTAAISSGTDKTTMAMQFGLTTTVTFNVNGKDITVQPTNSINDLATQINNAGAGVYASYDSNTDRFYMYSSGTGSSSKIDFSGSNATGLSFVTNVLKLSAYSSVDSKSGVASTGDVRTVDAYTKFSTAFSGETLPSTVSFTIDGQTVSLDPTVDSMQSLMNKINNLQDGGGNAIANASYTNGKLTIKSASNSTPITLAATDADSLSFLNNQLQMTGITGGDNTITSSGVTSSSAIISTAAPSSTLSSFFPGLSGTFNLKLYDGTSTYTVNVDTATDTMDSLVSKINAVKNSSGTQVAQALYSNGKFTLESYSSDPNTKTTFDLSSSDSAAMNFLNNQLQLNLTTNRTGTDAKVLVDGNALTESTNSFTVAGMTYNILSTGSTTGTVAVDTDTIVKNVQSFVDSYNSLLGLINGKLSEQYDPDYPPLTDSQKSSMSDSDISLWTTKAKTGLLQRDDTLRTLSSALQDIFANAVGGITDNYTTAASLGITTESYTEKGKLHFDSSVLTAALQNDPDAAYNLFGRTGTDSSSNGIAVQLNSALTTASASIVDEAGYTATSIGDTTSSLGKEISDYATRLSEMSDRLDDQETRYYDQFSQMETALSKLNSQSSYLSSLLSST